jgi:hypothetical protein
VYQVPVLLPPTTPVWLLVSNGPKSCGGLKKRWKL